MFAGSRRQRVGGIFGTLKKFFTPIGKMLGKNLLSSGLGLASDVARDAMMGKNVKDAIMTHGKTHAKNFGKTVANEGLSALSSMVGKGSRRAPRRHVRFAKRRKTKRLHRSVSRRRRRSSRKHVSRKRVSRKRRAPSTHKRRTKRRRVAANF